ncbi:Beta-keratin-related protein [Platysternon megacephalum]|uniref:Beta-keratin-related protein n=1 Tax=Platysternon megacephalum TaxID=55544 RepID=A0A4D9DIN5_9SAUR|nr:Beta-keratin-related protein [Platysternon megacephalum]
MSSYGQLCNTQCYAPCNVTCPQPIVDACNKPCITSCGGSRAMVYPPPIVVTFSGPLLSFCPQESVVGSSAHFDIGSSLSSGGSLGYGGSYGSGRLYNYGRSYTSGLSAVGSGCSYPYSSKCFSTYL